MELTIPNSIRSSYFLHLLKKKFFQQYEVQERFSRLLTHEPWQAERQQNPERLPFAKQDGCLKTACIKHAMSARVHQS